MADLTKVLALCAVLPGYTPAVETALRAAVASRADHYEAADAAGLVNAATHFIANGSWPAWFAKAIPQADLDKAHQRRQELVYARHNRPAPVPMQVPPGASAFHQFGTEELVPVAEAGYGYARLGGQYVVTRPAAAAPVDPLAIVPFGLNTPKGLGYAAWAGDSTTGRQLGHRMPERKPTKKKAPGRETDDATYGGWSDIPDATRGHSEPWQTVSKLIDPTPVKRRRGATWKGNEDFTPQTTSEHPSLFYVENPAFGQGVRKSAVEQPTMKHGGGWLQVNQYGAVPQTIKDSAGNLVPYPETVSMRVNFAAGTKRKGVASAAAETAFAQFANAPDVDYRKPTMVAGGKALFSAKHKAGTARNRRQKLSKLGAYGTFEASKIPAASFPKAEVFDPKAFGPFKAAGYGPGEAWAGAGVSPLDAPPSPILTGGGWEEKAETLIGRHVPGMTFKDVAGDEWHVLEGVYDAVADTTTATIGRPRSW